MSGDQNMTNENQEMQIEQDGDRANGDNMDNEDERKLFVGGLNWETTENDLRDYMSRFGKVSSCNLKRDLDSGRSRGFGFVVFEDKETVTKVLEQSEHKLQGNKIDPKRANPKGKNQEQPVKKIYVAKVSPSTTEQQIKDYFEQWGKVDKIEAPFDKEKDQRKNFVFVEFEDEETVNTLLKLTVDNPDYKHKLVNDEENEPMKPSLCRERAVKGTAGRMVHVDAVESIS